MLATSILIFCEFLLKYPFTYEKVFNIQLDLWKVLYCDYKSLCGISRYILLCKMLFYKMGHNFVSNRYKPTKF